MAINATPANHKGFTFDGVSSKTYGVYIRDTAAFNSPERDVEMIEIPGRSGAYALDKGRFSNIEVTYDAFIAAGSEADFNQAISDLRNQLASRKGYCILTDEFNDGEFRKAVYKSGLDVSNVNPRAGGFTVIFDCKPQRFLDSGTTPFTISASTYTINNPTLFASQPLLYIAGHGTVTIGDVTVTIDDDVPGNLYIDCELMEAYYTDHTPANSMVTLSGHEYPTIPPGTSTITKTGITSIQVTPRWWMV